VRCWALASPTKRFSRFALDIVAARQVDGQARGLEATAKLLAESEKE
jgi:hypothetical protein